MRHLASALWRNSAEFQPARCRAPHHGWQRVRVATIERFVSRSFGRRQIGWPKHQQCYIEPLVACGSYFRPAIVRLIDLGWGVGGRCPGAVWYFMFRFKGPDCMLKDTVRTHPVTPYPIVVRRRRPDLVHTVRNSTVWSAASRKTDVEVHGAYQSPDCRDRPTPWKWRTSCRTSKVERR